MSYKMNSAIWNGVFVVPNCVVDEHIKKAGGQQVKVLLFLLRHNSESLDARAVAKGTGMDVGDVKDAMSYWKEVGLIYEDGETPPEVMAAERQRQLSKHSQMLRQHMSRLQQGLLRTPTSERSSTKFSLNSVELLVTASSHNFL